ncbi:hypothetical protein FRC10_006971 [Ceratobasidium sp. 414]|nr:hypothetical protein FRC10_006971 [Ceratobasidium sp. 414]
MTKDIPGSQEGERHSDTGGTDYETEADESEHATESEYEGPSQRSRLPHKSTKASKKSGMRGSESGPNPLSPNQKPPTAPAKPLSGTSGQTPTTEAALPGGAPIPICPVARPSAPDATQVDDHLIGHNSQEQSGAATSIVLAPEPCFLGDVLEPRRSPQVEEDATAPVAEIASQVQVADCDGDLMMKDVDLPDGIPGGSDHGDALSAVWTELTDLAFHLTHRDATRDTAPLAATIRLPDSNTDLDSPDSSKSIISSYAGAQHLTVEPSSSQSYSPAQDLSERVDNAYGSSHDRSLSYTVSSTHWPHVHRQNAANLSQGETFLHSFRPADGEDALGSLRSRMAQGISWQPMNLAGDLKVDEEQAQKLRDTFSTEPIAAMSITVNTSQLLLWAW